MKHRTPKWLALAILAGFLAAAPATYAQGYYGSRPGARVDIHRDRAHLRHLRGRIHRDRCHLRYARRNIGPESWQARASRHCLHRDQRRYVRQANDLRRDRRRLWARGFR